MVQVGAVLLTLATASIHLYLFLIEGYPGSGTMLPIYQLLFINNVLAYVTLAVALVLPISPLPQVRPITRTDTDRDSRRLHRVVLLRGRDRPLGQHRQDHRGSAHSAADGQRCDVGTRARRTVPARRARRGGAAGSRRRARDRDVPVLEAAACLRPLVRKRFGRTTGRCRMILRRVGA